MGMNTRDIGVFVFLFTQRWAEKKIGFSASGIVKKLNPVSGMIPKDFRTTYSEKSVRTSLTKLTTLGFITECKNNERKSTGGRPANILYETSSARAIRENVTKNLDVYKQEIIHTISSFEDMEEGIALKEGTVERK